MKTIPFAFCAALLASIAFGDGLAITFDPPQKVEAVKAGEKDGYFFAAIVGAVAEKEFSKVAYVGLDKGKPTAARAEESSRFPILSLDKAVMVRSLVFTWKEGVVTCYLQSEDETLRIDFKKEADKGIITEVEAKEVPKWEMFPQFKITPTGGPDFIEAKEPSAK